MVHHLYHTPFSSHGFEHIPECHTRFGRKCLLVTNQTLHTRHGTQFAVFILVFSISHPDNQDRSLWKGSFQTLYYRFHRVLVIGIVHHLIRSHIQPVLQHNQIVCTQTVVLAKYRHRNITQLLSAASARTEIIDYHTLTRIHRHGIEQSCRVQLFHFPAHRADTSVHRHRLQLFFSTHRKWLCLSSIDRCSQPQRIGSQEITGRHFASVNMRQEAFLTFQANISSRRRNKIMIGNVLTGTVKIGGIRNGVTAPSTKRMVYRRAETGYFRCDGHISPPTSAKTFLQHFT